MKTDTELLEYLLGEIEAISESIEPDLPENSAAIDRLEGLATDIYDHLGSKAIQSDYVLPGWL